MTGETGGGRGGGYRQGHYLDDGRQWIVPADTHVQTAMKAADLYSQCNGVRLRQLSDLNLKNVQVIDAGGEEIFTTFVWSSNFVLDNLVLMRGTVE